MIGDVRLGDTYVIRKVSPGMQFSHSHNCGSGPHPAGPSPLATPAGRPCSRDHAHRLRRELRPQHCPGPHLGRTARGVPGLRRIGDAGEQPAEHQDDRRHQGADVPAPLHGAIQFRSATVGAGYRTKVSIAANGTLTVSLSRVAGGVETAFGTPVNTGITVKPGETIRLQGLVAGLDPVITYVRAWKSGAATPNWQLAATDYTAARITTAGATRLWGYLSATAASATTVSFSNVITDFVTAESVASYPVKSWLSRRDRHHGRRGACSGPGTCSVARPRRPRVSRVPRTTGVKAGSTLTRHDGDITVTKDGTVLSQPRHPRLRHRPRQERHHLQLASSAAASPRATRPA